MTQYHKYSKHSRDGKIKRVPKPIKTPVTCCLLHGKPMAQFSCREESVERETATLEQNL